MVEEAGKPFFNIPISDHTLPTPPQVAYFKSIAAHYRSLFCHCKSSVGRTGVMLNLLSGETEEKRIIRTFQQGFLTQQYPQQKMFTHFVKDFNILEESQTEAIIRKQWQVWAKHTFILWGYALATQRKTEPITQAYAPYLKGFPENISWTGLIENQREDQWLAWVDQHCLTWHQEEIRRLETLNQTTFFTALENKSQNRTVKP